jgi:hypothetical protein
VLEVGRLGSCRGVMLVGFRLRLFTLAEELGNVSAACRAMGIHRSTYYRLKRKVDRWGLRHSTRERRAPTDAERDWPPPRAADRGLRTGPSRPGALGASPPSCHGEVGRHADLRARRLARSAPDGVNTLLKAPGLVARHRDPYERRLNVRTYMTYGRRPGIYFFSLDAARRLAVIAARRAYRLPHFHARMAAHRHGDGGTVDYESTRIGSSGPRAEVRARYGPYGPRLPDLGRPPDRWLAERYCLYVVDDRGRVPRGEIHHAPWPLQPARALFRTTSNRNWTLLGPRRVRQCAPTTAKPPRLRRFRDVGATGFEPATFRPPAQRAPGNTAPRGRLDHRAAAWSQLSPLPRRIGGSRPGGPLTPVGKPLLF